MAALWVIVLQMSTQKQCHEFIVVAMSGRAAAAASKLAVPANECPSESHQLCRAYRRAPCGRRRPPAATLRNFSAGNFPQFPKQPLVVLCPHPLFKNVQNENRSTGTHVGALRQVKYILVDYLTRWIIKFESQYDHDNEFFKRQKY